MFFNYFFTFVQIGLTSNHFLDLESSMLQFVSHILLYVHFKMEKYTTEICEAVIFLSHLGTEYISIQSCPVRRHLLVQSQ